MKSEIDFYENFFSEKESARFSEALQSQIHWQQKTIKLFGKKVLEPRLTAWHGDPDALYTYSGTTLTPQPWIPALLEIKSRAEAACRSCFNSVLLNYYRDQHDSMGLHSDDEKELGPEPVIASVSFGATRRFILKPRLGQSAPAKTLALSSGSLLIMRGLAQTLYKHGIPKETKPCGGRINLTFRKILTPNI